MVRLDYRPLDEIFVCKWSRFHIDLDICVPSSMVRDWSRVSHALRHVVILVAYDIISLVPHLTWLRSLEIPQEINGIP